LGFQSNWKKRRQAEQEKKGKKEEKTGMVNICHQSWERMYASI